MRGSNTVRLQVAMAAALVSGAIAVGTFACAGSSSSPSADATAPGSVADVEPRHSAAADGAGSRTAWSEENAPAGRAMPPATSGLTPRELDVLFDLATLRDIASSADLARVVLQPDVLDIITGRVVRTVADALRTGTIDVFDRRPLLRLRSYEFVQEEQRVHLLEDDQRLVVNLLRRLAVCGDE